MSGLGVIDWVLGDVMRRLGKEEEEEGHVIRVKT